MKKEFMALIKQLRRKPQKSRNIDIKTTLSRIKILASKGVDKIILVSERDRNRTTQQIISTKLADISSARIDGSMIIFPIKGFPGLEIELQIEKPLYVKPA